MEIDYAGNATKAVVDSHIMEDKLEGRNIDMEEAKDASGVPGTPMVTPPATPGMDIDIDLGAGDCIPHLQQAQQRAGQSEVSADYTRTADNDLQSQQQPRPSVQGQLPSGSLDNCLRMLQSNVNEQRLVGLLLATKFVAGSDVQVVRKVFDCIGFDFIDRLLKTGDGGKGEDEGLRQQYEAYTQLALSILSSFSRLPELAARPEMLGKIPFCLKVIQSVADEKMKQDAYECLLSVASASESGLSAMNDGNAILAVSGDLKAAVPGAPWVLSAILFMKLFFTKDVDDCFFFEYKDQVAAVVPTLARELASRGDAVKFEALSLLICILAPDAAEPVRKSLGDRQEGAIWSQDMRTGIGHILHSRIDVENRQQALRLARVAVELQGESWLAGPMQSPTNGEDLPSDRFFVLIVESLRVEIPLLLADMARLTFEELEQRDEKVKQQLADKGNKAQDGMGGDQVDMNRSSNWGALLSQMGDPTDWQTDTEWQEEASQGAALGPSPQLVAAQQSMGEMYAVLEHVIEAMSAAATGLSSGQNDNKNTSGSRLLASLNDVTVKRAVSAVDASVGVVLDFIEEAKKHELNVDAGVLASVRLAAKYLAEAPEAHRKQVSRLLSFMLSVRSEEEDLAIQAVRFLLPVLLQLTAGPQACNSLVKRGGHKCVVSFVQESARTNMMGVLRGGEHSHNGLVEACDVLLNIFGLREELKVKLEALDFAPLLPAMVGWSSASGVSPKQKTTILAMAACVITSVLELTTEEELKKRLDLASYKRLPRAMKVIVAFLEEWHKASLSPAGAPEDERDLYDIAVATSAECMPNWPYLKRAFVSSSWWQELFKGKTVTTSMTEQATPDPLLRELLALAAVP